MSQQVRLAIIGDHNPAIVAHQAIPLALNLAAQTFDLDIHTTWLNTDTIDAQRSLEEFDAFWCVPGSPYQSTEGALHAIRYAREQQKPFLGTCGGFQHAIIEYARNVMAGRTQAMAKPIPKSAGDCRAGLRNGGEEGRHHSGCRQHRGPRLR
ncbi:CTP synthase [Ewingella americana]|uniref:CTP synthase (glutamine hydrolyzing) n=1 Tax=Ewingella americana TaxID=41202 RepID=A0A377NIH6_9GAMM|nr:CTP synthase [Ewingella americana]